MIRIETEDTFFQSVCDFPGDKSQLFVILGSQDEVPLPQNIRSRHNVFLSYFWEWQKWGIFFVLLFGNNMDCEDGWII